MSNSGVYLLINDDNEVVYVGRSKNISCRVSAHKKDKIFSHVSVIDCDQSEQKKIEREMIHNYMPIYNKQIHKHELSDMIAMRIELSDDENRQLMKAKTGELKTAYAKRVLMEAVKRDNKKKEKTK